MTLEELTETERHALAALVRLMIRIDGIISPEEAIALAEIAPTLGGRKFWDLMNHGHASPEASRDLAREVTRPETRAFIYELLYKVAEADGIVGREAKLLEWLSRTWQLS